MSRHVDCPRFPFFLLWEPIRTLSQIEFTFTYVLQISDIRQLNVQATARTFKHKLHLSQSRQWREALNYALLDQSWDRHTEADTTYDCCDHPEIGTLRRTHCTVGGLHFASGLVISVAFDPIYLITLQLILDVISPTWRCCWRLQFPNPHTFHM